MSRDVKLKLVAHNRLADRKTSPLIIAHRGASARAPENTLAAFARAMEQGADGIELDVRLSRDGVPVVIHDANLRRVGRRKAKVADLNSGQLTGIDVGSWFNRANPQRACPEYTTERLPTLSDVFRLLTQAAGSELVVYVELKTGRQADLNQELANRVVNVIRRHRMNRRAVVISFNLKTVAKVKENDASIRTGALFGPKQRATKSARQMFAAALRCHADQILLHKTIFTRKMIDLALARNLVPVVWTVDDPQWIARAWGKGIHAFMTNDPALVRRSLGLSL